MDNPTNSPQPNEGFFERVKKEIHIIEETLKMSTDEVKAQYAEQRTHLRSWLEEARGQLKTIEKRGEAAMQQIEEEAAFIVDLLDADTELSYTEYEQTPHKLTDALEKFEHHVQNVIRSADHLTDEAREQLQAEYQEKLHQFKTQIAMKKAFFESNAAQGEAAFSQWKTDMGKEVDRLKEKVDSSRHTAEARVEHFAEEMKSALSHFKKAFKL